MKRRKPCQHYRLLRTKRGKRKVLVNKGIRKRSYGSLFKGVTLTEAKEAKDKGFFDSPWSSPSENVARQFSHSKGDDIVLQLRDVPSRTPLGKPKFRESLEPIKWSDVEGIVEDG